MSCNRDGVASQTAGSALGAGDTEVLQMSARNGKKLWDDTGVTRKDIPELADIETAVNLAEANDERKPFVINFDGSGEYQTFDTIVEAMANARKTGGGAYVYEENPTSGNSPRTPVAIFDTDGNTMMMRQDYRTTGYASQVWNFMDKLEDNWDGYSTSDAIAFADDALKAQETFEREGDSGEITQEEVNAKLEDSARVLGDIWEDLQGSILNEEEVTELTGLYGASRGFGVYGSRDVARIAHLEARASEKQLAAINEANDFGVGDDSE